MKYFNVLFTCLVLAVTLCALLSPTQVEAGKKQLLKKAALTAMLLKGGKKILLPLPIPVPIPFLKQKEPVYYQSYSSGSSY